MSTFFPDYRNVVDAAYNRMPKRLPLYEHIVDVGKIGEILGKDFCGLWEGDQSDLKEYFSYYCGFFRDHGYDVVPFECCIGESMPGSGALGNSRMVPAIKNREDFANYPWKEIPDLYFQAFGKYFAALKDQMPEGMKAVGGVGNGIFECVQDLTGYENLCLMMYDDEELFADIFQKAGETNLEIWRRFMEQFGDVYCVLRFGDDMGYKNNTLLSAETLRKEVVPRYKPIIDLVHQYRKPFLLHSCGQISSVMEDLIEAGIDAKHSNEDQIAPFSWWVDTYGERIGNFGGLDVDALCQMDRGALKEYTLDILTKTGGCKGIAIGTGNSIPAYVPAEGYLNMIEFVREYRGDFN